MEEHTNKVYSCPSPEANAEMITACKERDLNVKFKVEGSCTIARCVPKEDTIRFQCAEQDYTAIQQVKEECRLASGTLVEKFDAQGCAVVTCSSPINRVCATTMPEETINTCAEKGGEMIVQKDTQGCIVHNSCIVVPEEIEVEEIENVPDTGELVEIALRIGELRGELRSIQEKASTLTTYYRDNENTAGQEKFERITSMFTTAIASLNDLEENLRTNAGNMTETDLIEIKKQLRYLSDVVLPNILRIVYEEPAEQERECRSDDECFMDAYRVCESNASVSHREDDFVFRANITGIENERCVMQIEMEQEGTEYTMTCRDPNYASGFFNDPREVCNGNLVAFMDDIEEGQRTEGEV
jgi:hypothetical protein